MKNKILIYISYLGVVVLCFTGILKLSENKDLTSESLLWKSAESLAILSSNSLKLDAMSISLIILFLFLLASIIQAIYIGTFISYKIFQHQIHRIKLLERAINFFRGIHTELVYLSVFSFPLGFPFFLSNIALMIIFANLYIEIPYKIKKEIAGDENILDIDMTK